MFDRDSLRRSQSSRTSQRCNGAIPQPDTRPAGAPKSNPLGSFGLGASSGSGTPFGKIVLNRAPRMDQETTQVVDNNDGTFTITPSATDPDGDELTYSASGSGAGEGTLTDNGNGTFTYTVTSERTGIARTPSV